MSTWKERRKQWLERKAREGNKRKHRKKQKNFQRYSNSSKVVRKRTHGSPTQVNIVPPNNFSLINNAEETISFFQDFKAEIDKRERGTHYYIDSSSVKQVTVDAIIYLIAILQNDPVNIAYHYSFSGNYPADSEACRIYKESGFEDYVFSHRHQLPESNKKMKILSGTDNNSEAAKELSDFVITNLGKAKKEIHPLQKTLIELMSNVYYHAYEKNSFMAKKWYIYAEHTDDYIRCIFVDTGLGIAQTAKKNFAERFGLLFGKEVNDGKIINSIFKGDFRTATNERFRGNGLSSVRNNLRSEIFREFEVFSGRGRCIIPTGDESDDIVSLKLNNRLYGTLFHFVIC